MILSINLRYPFPPDSVFWKARRPLVLACGCFDILTIGHVRHLKEAKRLGTCLCVLVTADRYVQKPGRPIVPENQRAEVVDALGCVDLTIVNPHPTAVEAIRCLSPQFYVKGWEYRGSTTDMSRGSRLYDEIRALKEIGGRIEFTDTDEVHTTDVVARLLEVQCK